MPGPNDNPSGEPSFQDILQFDPFDGGAGEPNGDSPSPPDNEQPPGEGEAEGQQVEGQEGQQPPAAQPVTPQQPPMSAADMANLIREQASATAEAVRAAVQPQASPQAAPQNKFNLGVPDELAAALRSEDPAQFKAGLGGLINGISNHLWTTFQNEMRDTFAPAVRQMIENYQSTAKQQDEVAKDFYGTYPMFQNPLMTQMVQTAGQAVAQEFQQTGKPIAWSPALRDAIAEKIFEVLPHLRPQQEQQQQQQRPPAARRPFVAGGGGARSAPVETPQDDMMKMIFGG